MTKLTQSTQTIVITGASRGIGQATAVALANPNVHLALFARSSERLMPVAASVRERGATTTVVAGDATLETDVQRLFATIGATTHKVDVLIHSVGTALMAPFDMLALQDWEGILRTNLTSAFLSCKYASPHMGDGSLIINVVSIAARQAFPGWAAYTAAKYGLLGFSQAIREELRPRGIRVTTVLPAATDTELWTHIPGDWNRANMLQPHDVAQAIAHLVDQPTYVTTEELVIGHRAGRL